MFGSEIWSGRTFVVEKKYLRHMSQFFSPYVVKYYGSYFKNTDLWVCLRHHVSRI